MSFLFSGTLAVETAERLDALIATATSPRDPGLAVAVLHKGEPIYKRVLGLANLTHEAPLTDRSVMRIASQSKQITGKSFNEALKQYITGPLGMADTRLMVRDDEIYPRLADHHRRGAKGEWLKSAWGIAIGGEGGLVSTLSDMILWQQNLRSPKIGTAEMVERMGRSFVTIDGVASPYGLGLVNTRHKGVPLVGHGGWIAGSRSESFRVPSEDLTFIVLSNHDDFSSFGLARDMLDIVLSREPGGLISPEGIAALKAGYGFWRSEEGGFVFRLEESGGLPAMAGSMGVSSLEEIEPGIFQPRGALPPFRFSVGTDGTITTEKFGRRRRYRRIEGKMATIGDASGSYMSEETGLSATIGKAGDRWLMRVSSPFGAASLELESCDRDIFLAHPADRDLHDIWRIAPWVLPWLYTVLITEDGLVFNSDRGRDVVLKKTG